MFFVQALGATQAPENVVMSKQQVVPDAHVGLPSGMHEFEVELSSLPTLVASSPPSLPVLVAPPPEDDELHAATTATPAPAARAKKTFKFRIILEPPNSPSPPSDAAQYTDESATGGWAKAGLLLGHVR
jgi:hypothetical protein